MSSGPIDDHKNYLSYPVYTGKSKQILHVGASIGSETIGLVKIVDKVNSQLTFVGWASGTKDTPPDISKSIWLIKRIVSQGSIVIREEFSDNPFKDIFAHRSSLFNDITFSNILETSLDGVNDHITGGNIFNFDISDAFTIGMWLKPQNIAATRILFSKAGIAPNVRGYMLRSDATTGKLFLQMRSPSANRTHTFNSALVAGGYQSILFSYSGSSNISGAKVYKDGVLDTNLPPSGTLGGSWLEGQPFILGSRNLGFFYNGLMDEVNVWNKEFTDSEALEWHNSGSPIDVTLHSTYPGSLISDYGMGDGDTHPTIFDRFGSNDLTMVNMTSNDFIEDVP